jgi:DNA-directed RNA polymerase subunit RPC12/RpoP
MDFDDWLVYELCVPGGISGETEVDCPHCGQSLNVAVDDPDGEERYTCCECGKAFNVDWVNGTMRWQS